MITTNQEMELYRKIQIELQMGRSIQVDKVLGAIAKVQMSTKLSKNRTAHQYKYADLPSILNTLAEPFAECGIVLYQPLWKDAQIHSRNEVQTYINHIESGQWIMSKIEIPDIQDGSRNALQALGGMITYLRRYSLLSILGLEDQDDDGKESGEHKVRREVITENQVGLLKRKMADFPQQAKYIKDVDLPNVLKSDFETLLSYFPR